MADANADNFRVFNHFFDVDRASSAQQVLGILNRYEGIPWVNTIVADKQGHALYADIGAVPNVPDAPIDGQLSTLGGDDEIVLTIAAPLPLTREQLTAPPVVRCVNPFGKG